MENILVSIVMPVYNAEKTIGQSIDSVINQYYTNFELIIVDDGSTDATLQIVKARALNEHRIKYYTINNSGVPKIPRDYAIKCSKGTFIIALDSDDYLSVDYLSKLVALYQKSKPDIILTKMVILGSDHREIYHLPLISVDYEKLYCGKDLIKYTLSEWKIGMNGAFIHRKLFSTLCSIDDKDIFMNSDEYDSRIFLLNADKVAFCNAEYFYENNENSVTRKFAKKNFDRLIIDKKVQDFIYTHYSITSIERSLADMALFSDLLSLSILFEKSKKKLNTVDVEDITSLLKKTYQHCQDSSSLSRYGTKYKILLSKYFIFVLIVRLYVAYGRK